MTRSLLSAALLLVLASAPVTAQTAAPTPAAPLHLTVTKPLTPVKDVLASLSKQSGVLILADDTVVDTLGVTTLDKPTVPEMLNTLTALTPGLTWQRIDLPSDAPVPDANTLSAQARELRALTATRLTITDPATHTSLRFSRTAPDIIKTSDTPDRTVYLVTNETVRAQRLADQQAKAKKESAAPAPVDHAVAGMQTAADELGGMTADQQRQAIPLMMQQMMRMFQSIDPSVRAEIGQRWQQRRNGGGGMPGQ